MRRPVRFRGTKWPDRPHWEFDAQWLGADAHGQWIGLPAGTWLSRPGAGFHAPSAQVVLLPHDDWWCATFHDHTTEHPVDLYVDITTVPTWTEDEVGCVDLDLDVIRGVTGRVWVDDEEEFARHSRQFDYPSDVVDAALDSCARVLSSVEALQAPFDRDTSTRWLARLRAPAPSRPST